MDYPKLNKTSLDRERELLIALDFAHKQFGDNLSVELGNDEIGVPDAFLFHNNKLVACVELVGYVLGSINEIKSHTQTGKFEFSIDIEKCTEVHKRQNHPYTLINKKILGARQYQRYDAEKLILLIHTEVYVKNGSLRFAMDGIMQMNSNVNNFMHHKTKIVNEIESVVQNNQPTQWDKIYLADYTHSPNIECCPLIEIK